MKSKLRLFISAATVLLFVACEHDFIEDDLTGKTVTILAPAADDTVATSSPIFWWNEIAGARSYRVQIVLPDFTSPQQLVYDTAVVGDRFYPSLIAGSTYYWRIRPENGSSEGDWITRRITVDSSVSLANQTVTITLPASNNTSTSSGTVPFSWNSVAGAQLYRMDVTNTTSGANVVTTTSTVNNYTATLAQGNYEFRVRAENSSSFTAWSTRTFSVDQAAPTVPLLIFPADDAFYASAPSAIAFDWGNSTDAFTDSLEVATDSTFSTGVVLAVSLSATQSTYTWTGVQGNFTYFWRVRSFDAAGNASNYSAIFRFDVN
ncbi:MAG TPA: hypothetical protein VK826_12435 [Bacteroidia bacterium]|nr:hypothetical protein [Bacteroidia bacterium]